MAAPHRSRYNRHTLAVDGGVPGNAVFVRPHMLFGSSILTIPDAATGLILPTAGEFSAAQQAQLQGSRVLLYKAAGNNMTIAAATGGALGTCTLLPSSPLTLQTGPSTGALVAYFTQKSDAATVGAYSVIAEGASTVDANPIFF